MGVLITGATGFIGSAVLTELIKHRISVRQAVRYSDPLSNVIGPQKVTVGQINLETDWSAALVEIDCVIHCAARPYVTHETESDGLAAYRAINVAGTRRLAEQSAEFGVKRLVYLSSIKVNGEQTALGAPFRADVSPQGFASRDWEGKGSLCDDSLVSSLRAQQRSSNLFSVSNPSPKDPYGVSKWEAEQALWEVAARTGLEVVVVRPPLVYGPGVKGNLLYLAGMVARGLPLPLGAVHNQRSLVGLANLVDLLVRCINHPAAAGQTFLVSDGEDLSTPQLIQLLAQGMNQSAHLLPVPLFLLRFTAALLGKRAEIDRLVGSLQVDSNKTCELLNWKAPVSVKDGIREMAQWYLRTHSSLGH